MSHRQLKFSSDLPVHLEKRLIHEHGYYIWRRVYRESILFEKLRKDVPVVIKEERFLAPQEEVILETRCDNIVDYFPDPYKAILSVRERLYTLARQLPQLEKNYVHKYIEDNFPLNSAVDKRVHNLK